MNPASILLYLFDWRGVLSRGAYRRNLSILVLSDRLIDRLDLLSGAALYAWTATAIAIGVAFAARRYHDMGRSAAWLIWANLISAAAAIVIFQFIPNVLDAIPLPEDWRVSAAGAAVFGRFALPAIVGALIGNIVQSLWLAGAPSKAGQNSFAAAATTTPRRALADSGDEGPNEAALQAVIDRHLAARQSAPTGAAPRHPASVIGLNDRQRQFGRRGR